MTAAFLFCSFLFPRLTLLVCALFGMMPANDTPLVADVIAFFVAPRLLIAWWLYEAGAHPLLVVLFAVGGLTELFGGGQAARSRRSRSS